MSNNKSMMGKIALGRKQIAAYADDETWRGMLEEIGGDRSVAAMGKMPDGEKRLARIVDFLAQRGAVFASAGSARKTTSGAASGKPYRAGAAGRRSEFYEIPDTPLAPLKRKICKLWQLLGYDMLSIDTRIKNQFKVESLRWCQDQNALSVIAHDLTVRLKRKNEKTAIV